MSPNRRPTAGATAPESSECRLFASTVHGLESVAAEELTARGHTVRAVRKRQVLLDSPRSLASDRPRTVDDLLPLAASTADPGPAKEGLVRVRKWLSTTELDLVPDELADAVFSVSASIVGRRNFNRYDLEETVGTGLAERLGARFASRRGGARPPADAVEWRVALAPERLLLGLRGRRAPLHRREWKTASVPGTLHPPVAAAMARLARIEAGMAVLDPCCGAGTVLAEARERHPEARFAGRDLDPAALAASGSNTRHLPDIAWTRGDAARLPLRAGTIDRIVTNPAWGRQVAARRPFPELLTEWHRVLAANARLVCLVAPDQLPQFDSQTGGWKTVAVHPISLAGRHPVIVVAEPAARFRHRRART